MVIIEELTFYDGNAVSVSLFALDDTRTAIQLLLHAVVSSSAKHSHRLDIFPNRCGLGHEITKLGVKLPPRALESQR